MAAQEPVKQKLNLALDLRVVVALLLVVILGMLLLWRPWEGIGTSDRTISVTGQATVSAEPDEFVFYPSYNFKNSDTDAALEALAKKSETVVAKLKDLGVPNGGIKTNANNYDVFYGMPESEKSNFTLTLTVTVGDKDLAQKVQDYLLTTSPSGNVTPQYTFSDAKQRELESQARDQATKDARAKAEQSAKNLGFKIGKVKEVTDGQGFGIHSGRLDAAVTEDAKMTLQPGENELSYSVTVVYFVK